MKQTDLQKSIRKFLGKCPLWEPSVSGIKILKCGIRNRYVWIEFIWRRIQTNGVLLDQLGGRNSSSIPCKYSMEEEARWFLKLVKMIEGKHEVIHIFHQIMQFDLQDSPNILTRQSVLHTDQLLARLIVWNRHTLVRMSLRYFVSTDIEMIWHYQRLCFLFCRKLYLGTIND
jgi:hypothetical protein